MPHDYPDYVKRKNIHLHIKIDQGTQKELDTLCKKTGHNKSEIIRRSVHYAYDKNSNSSLVTKDFLKKNAQVLQAMDKLNTALNALRLEYCRIGVNLNQIAKKLNAGEANPEAVKAINDSIEKDITQIHQRFRSLVRWLYSS